MAPLFARAVAGCAWPDTGGKFRSARGAAADAAAAVLPARKSQAAIVVRPVQLAVSRSGELPRRSRRRRRLAQEIFRYSRQAGAVAGDPAETDAGDGHGHRTPGPRPQSRGHARVEA